MRRYALAGLPAGGVAAAVAWDGLVTRPEAILLIAAYIVFVTAIWVLERHPPALGETADIEEAAADADILHGPWLVMLVALAAVIALTWRTRRLDRRPGAVCLVLYPAFVTVVLTT